MPDVVPPGSTITSDLLTYRSPYVVTHASLTANSGGATGTTEVLALSTPAATFTAGRAYRIDYLGLAQHNAASTTALCYLRYRLGTTTSGTLIRNLQTVPLVNGGTGSRNMALNLSTIVTPAATVTNAVSLTFAHDSGSTGSTIVISGTAGTPGLLTVWDVGPASDFPGIATF